MSLYGFVSYDTAGRRLGGSDSVLTMVLIDTFTTSANVTKQYPAWAGRTLEVLPLPMDCGVYETTWTVTYPSGVPTVTVTFSKTSGRPTANQQMTVMVLAK